MADTDKTRASALRVFEQEAELLVAHQLDLLAQIEAQLRAVHHTMRRIERLRSAKLRLGPELSDGQRQTALMGLSAEVAELEKQFSEELNGCEFMQETISHMQTHLAELKLATRLESRLDGKPPDKDGSLGGAPSD